MSRIGLGSQGMVRFGASSSQDGQPLAGFEELAMPLFNSLYNFARWLVHNSNDAEDLYKKPISRLYAASHRFSLAQISGYFES